MHRRRFLQTAACLLAAPPFSPAFAARRAPDPGDALPGVVNRRPRVLPNWRRALARVTAGSGDAVVCFVGDSTTAGLGAGTGPHGLVGALALSTPSAFATILGQGGPPTQTGSWWGNHAVSMPGLSAAASLGQYDARLAIGAGWAPGVVCLGCTAWVNATTADPIRFTPADAIDRIEVYYIAAPGGSTFEVNVDAGAPLSNLATGATTVATAGGGAVTKATFACPLGIHTVMLVPSGTGPVFVAGMDTGVAASRKVRVWNMGWIASKTSDWVQTGRPWLPMNALPALGPDVVVLDLDINDWLNRVPVPTTRSNEQALIDAFRNGGRTDVVVVSPIQSDPASTKVPQATQDRFGAMVRQLAAADDLMMIDMPYRFGPYAKGDANRFDNVHFNAIGYADKARIIAEALAGP